MIEYFGEILTEILSKFLSDRPSDIAVYSEVTLPKMYTLISTAVLSLIKGKNGALCRFILFDYLTYLPELVEEVAWCS